MLSDAESVMAVTVTCISNIEAVGTGVAILRFYNGALGIIESTMATGPKDVEGSISILDGKGAVAVSSGLEC